MVSIFRQDREHEAGPLSAADYQLLENTRGAFDWIGAVEIKPSNAVYAGDGEIATIAAVTPNLAAALALPLDKGAVLSHRVWESEFGGKEDAIGQVIRIGEADFKIAGVAPERLDGLYSDQSVDVWIQPKEQGLQSSGSDRRNLWVVARLREGVSAGHAENSMRSGSAVLREMSAVPFTGTAPNMARGLERVSVFLNFSAVAVFFIACMNVASFLLARALKRSHETSLRIALGATRADLMRDLFSDSVVISIAGGAMGLLAAAATAHMIPALLFAEDAERLSFATHFLPIVTASILCIIVTILCGMTPMVGTVTDRPWTVLQRETGWPSKVILRLRSGLVVGQIAACCMLAICTALLLDGLHAALETSAGHRLGDPVLLTVQAPPRRDGPEIDVSYFSRVEQRAKSVAGLSPLAWTARLPGDQPMWQSFRTQPFSKQYRRVAMDIAWLTPDSLRLLESQPVAGRMFGADDERHQVAVVDEEAAAEIFGKDSVGMIIRDRTDRPIEIIGVVKRRPADEKQRKRPTIYYGYTDQSAVPNPIRDAEFHIPLAPPRTGVELDANVVSADYFSALGMRLIAGRRFPDAPNPGLGRVAVINEEAADLYFHGQALGSGMIDDGGVRTEIIGVVKSEVFGRFEQHVEPAVYFAIGHDCPPRMTLMLRHSRWNRRTAAELESAIMRVPGSGTAPILIRTLNTQLAQSGLAPLRIATLIGTASAAIAILLSMLGLLSAQSDAERQRQRERALRVALGAQRWRIVLMVVNDAGRLTLTGTATGTLLSFALLRFVVAGIAGVPALPLEVWVIAACLPAAAVMMASVAPARRASAISPLAIMRDN